MTPSTSVYLYNKTCSTPSTILTISLGNKYKFPYPPLLVLMLRLKICPDKEVVIERSLLEPEAAKYAYAKLPSFASLGLTDVEIVKLLSLFTVVVKFK